MQKPYSILYFFLLCIYFYVLSVINNKWGYTYSCFINSCQSNFINIVVAGGAKVVYISTIYNDVFVLLIFYLKVKTVLTNYIGNQ